MYQLRSLITNLEKELKKLDINESIELRISNIPNFDFQINNLVKFQNSDDKKVIKKAIFKIIEADPYIKNFEFTEKYFVNLSYFYNKRLDQQVSISAQQTENDPNSFYYFTSNSRKAGYSRGAEFELKYQIFKKG